MLLSRSTRASHQNFLDARTEAWEKRFQELVQYKEKHGNCNVPQIYKQNPQLGRWVTEQRTTFDSMSEDRKKQLKSIGFVLDARTEAWEKRFQELVQYKEKHGNCNVPNRCKQNPQLGKWVHYQGR